MIDTSVWQRRWSVDSEAVGDGKAAMAYLAPYMIRGAVSNWLVDWCDDADSLDEAHCRLQVKRSGTRQYRPMALSVQEFIRRWLQHVLPAGLHRVRHYGFLHSSSRRSLKELRILIAVSNTSRPIASNFFEVERRMAWVCLEEPKVLVRQSTGGVRKLFVAIPERWSREVVHSDVDLPAECSRIAASASESSRPSFASVSMRLSNCAASKSRNHSRNFASSLGANLAIEFSSS